MKKELMFRKQRQDKIEANMRKLQADYEKAIYEQEDLTKSLDIDSED